MRKGRFNLAICLNKGDEEPVQSGLALTPGQMLELQSQGLPISSQIAGAEYDEGDTNPDFTPPLGRRRGVDVADLWEAEMDTKKAIGSAVKFKSKSVEPKAE